MSAISLPRLFLPLLLVVAAGPAAAEVYRWVDKDGVVHYTDRPPSSDAKPAQLPPLQTITGGFGSGARPAPKPAGGPEPESPTDAPQAITVTVVAPSAEEVFRNTDGRVNVSVALQQPLPAGGGLIYYLDGNAHNPSPIRDFTYTLSGVERGSHLASVAAVDGSGRELGRSAPVLFHMKPPIAR